LLEAGLLGQQAGSLVKLLDASFVPNFVLQPPDQLGDIRIGARHQIMSQRAPLREQIGLHGHRHNNTVNSFLIDGYHRCLPRTLSDEIVIGRRGDFDASRDDLGKVLVTSSTRGGP
jgi:hypothetical protein